MPPVSGAGPSSAPAPAQLSRNVSFGWLVLYGLGTTIGAGIYVLVGVAAGRAGALAPLAFALASLLALPTAFSFAELSARFPRAGGEAVYVQEAMRRRALSTVVGLGVVAAGLISAATVSVGFAGYLNAIVPAPPAAIAAAAVVATGAVAVWGVQASVVVAGLMTLLELGGLALVVGFGAPILLDLGRTEVANRLLPSFDSPGAAWNDLWRIAATSVLCFYAFLGFEDMVNVAEEVRDVRRVLPRAILTTLAVVALAYGVVTTVAVVVVPPPELAEADAPLALVFERSGGPASWLRTIALFALLNGALVQVMKSARVLYGMARDGALPGWLGSVHPSRHTPWLATIVATAITAALAVAFPLALLAEATAVITLATFTLANASLVVVKRRDPHPSGIQIFPVWIPMLGTAVSALFVAVEVASRLGVGQGGAPAH